MHLLFIDGSVDLCKSFVIGKSTFCLTSPTLTLISTFSLPGVGSGLVTTMRFIVLRQWFRAKLGQALALSLMMDGTMAISPFIEFSFRHYGYTGTMIIVAAFSLHGLVAAATMVAPPTSTNRNQKPIAGSDVIKKLSVCENDDFCTYKEQRSRTESVESLENWEMSIGRHLVAYEKQEKSEYQEDVFESGASRYSLSSRKRTGFSQCSETYPDYQISHWSLELPSAFDTPSYTPSDTPLDTSLEIPLEPSLDKELELPMDVFPDIPLDSPLNSPLEKTSFQLATPGNFSPKDQRSCCSKMWQVICRYVDLRLLCCSRYVSYSLLMTCSSLASSMCNTHLAGMAAERTITSSQVALLLTAIGGVTTITKVTSGQLRYFKV